jgi:glycosyltransferase involved in cell wall biosynthesis
VNRKTLGLNDLTIAVSDEVRQSMNGVADDRVATITNGIDCAALQAVAEERQEVRSEFDIDDDDFLIVNVANLIPVKNHDMLVRAFSIFLKRQPNASLLLVGQLRETTESVRQLVAQLGLNGKVCIAGPRTDVPRIVKAADVFAMSSHSEGLPVSLLEAMVLGKPVVCTNVGGIAGVVTDGVEGFLVPAGNAALMADRFTDLYDDTGLRQRMGQSGREKVEAEYDISVMVREVEGEYRRILQEKGF